jgi:hypothetical protein
MRTNRRIVSRAAGLALGMALVTSIGLPGVASATPAPLFPQCPVAGADTGCAILLTVNPDGSTTVATDPGQPPMSPTGVLIGIDNDSNAVVSNVSLEGTSGPGAFTLTGQGVCAVRPRPCFSSTQFGPTGYEGPGTSFTIANSTNGTVDFAGGMSPGGGTYFSLASAPISVTAQSLVADVAVTASPVSAQTGVPFSGQVGTFAVGDSTAPASDFSATMAWGDGAVTTSSIGQPGGIGNPYVVSDAHTYASASVYPTTVTVTDTLMTAIANTGSDSSTATVVTMPVTMSPVTIPNQVVGTEFTGPVATFTDVDMSVTPASFTASIDWGALAGGVEQVSAGSVTQSGGPGTPFTVTGTNTYAQSGSFTLAVSVTFDSVTATLTEPIQVDAAQTTVPCEGSCSGGVTTPQQSDTGSTTGNGSLSISLADGSLSCDGVYDFAPQITTVTTTGIPSTSTVKVKIKFLRSDLQGPVGAALAVCFAWSHPFVDRSGNITPPVLLNGQTAFVGLLPACQPTRPQKFGPCLGHVSEPLPGWKTVQENIKFPAGDPRFR